MNLNPNNFMRDQKKASEYVKQWRANCVGRFCECGAPAIGNFSGAFECARCREMETKRAAFEARRPVVGIAEPIKQAQHVHVRQFAVRVMETALEIVVSAHGEYHLQLGGGQHENA